jgi:hypothetical protein
VSDETATALWELAEASRPSGVPGGAFRSVPGVEVVSMMDTMSTSEVATRYDRSEESVRARARRGTTLKGVKTTDGWRFARDVVKAAYERKEIACRQTFAPAGSSTKPPTSTTATCDCVP